MKKYRPMLVALAAGTVSACGSGGGGGSTPTPTPTSTPTPSPSPTPTPTPTPVADLPPGCPAIPADRGLVFDQVVAGIGYSAGSFDGFYASRIGGMLSHRPQDNSYVFSAPYNISEVPGGYNGSAVFLPSDEVTGDARFKTFRDNCTGGIINNYIYGHEFSIFRQSVAGSIPAAIYSSFGGFSYTSYSRSVFYYNNDYFFGIGSPTTSQNIPTSGAVTYNGSVYARGTERGAITADYKLVGTARIEVNFTTKIFTATLDFKEGNPNTVDLADADFGTHTFTNAAAPTLDHLVATSGEGEMTGFLSGPNAEELVLAYTLKIQDLRPKSVSYGLSVQIAGSAAASR